MILAGFTRKEIENLMADAQQHLNKVVEYVRVNERGLFSVMDLKMHDASYYSYSNAKDYPLIEDVGEEFYHWCDDEYDINNTDEQTGILDKEKHASHILRSGSMVVKIYLRQVIVDNNLSFPEGIFYEDNCAAPLWSLYFKHFEHVPEPMYYYLTLPQSTTHHVSWAKCEDRMSAGAQFIEATRRDGFYETYKDVIDYRFTELYYQITLFSYMYGGKNRKMKHTGMLKQGILKYVPDFRSNPYYEKMMVKEDRDFIDLQMKSNAAFFIKYVLLYGYRNFRKQFKRTKK